MRHLTQLNERLLRHPWTRTSSNPIRAGYRPAPRRPTAMKPLGAIIDRLAGEYRLARAQARRSGPIAWLRRTPSLPRSARGPAPSYATARRIRCSTICSMRRSRRRGCTEPHVPYDRYGPARTQSPPPGEAGGRTPACRPLNLGRMRAGTPIAVCPAGTSDRTSELAAIIAPSPIVTGPRMQL